LVHLFDRFGHLFDSYDSAELSASAARATGGRENVTLSGGILASPSMFPVIYAAALPQLTVAICAKLRWLQVLQFCLRFERYAFIRFSALF